MNHSLHNLVSMNAAIRVIPSWNLTLDEARTIISNRQEITHALTQRTEIKSGCNSEFYGGLLTEVLDLLSLPALLSLLGEMKTDYPVSCMLYRLSQMEGVACPIDFVRIAENELHLPAGKLLRVDV